MVVSQYEVSLLISYLELLQEWKRNALSLSLTHTRNLCSSLVVLALLSGCSSANESSLQTSDELVPETQVEAEEQSKEEEIVDEEKEEEAPAPAEKLIVIGNPPHGSLEKDFPRIEILDAEDGSHYQGWSFTSTDLNIFPDAGYAHHNAYSSAAWRRIFSKDFKKIVARKVNESSDTLRTEVGYLSDTGYFTNQSALAPAGNDFISEYDGSPSFAHNGDFTFARYQDNTEKYSKIYRVSYYNDSVSDVTPEEESNYGFMHVGDSLVMPTVSSSGRVTSDDGKFACRGASDISLQGMCLQISRDLITKQGTQLRVKAAAHLDTYGHYDWEDATVLLPKESNRVISSAVFSPDGQWIVFAAGKPTLGGKPESYDLYKISVTGGEPKKLSGSLSNDQYLIAWTAK